MKKYKVYVYAISKNESAFIDRWMDSVSEADGVIVVDTGSEDDTAAKLRARGAIVFEEKITPWRFDVARNSAMSHIPEDADICVSNDIDEVFEPGWREKLENAWDDWCTRARYWFVWEYHPDLAYQKKFYMEKIHRRHGFQWVHPVHEVLQYTGAQEDRTVVINDLYLIHKPDPMKSRGQYLPLLEMSAAENPQDDRTRFWLGREYFYKQLYDKAIATLQDYLKIESAVWPEERSAAMRFIAKSFRAQNKDEEALGWLYKAAAECPMVREPWLELARLGYEKENWPLTLWAAEKGLEVKESTNSYLVESASWGFLLDDFAAIAAYWLGLYPKALEHAKKACDISPEDKRLLNNFNIVAAKAEPEKAL